MYIARTVFASGKLPTPSIAQAIKECGAAFPYRKKIPSRIKIKFWIYKCEGERYKHETLIKEILVHFVDEEPFWNPNDLKDDSSK